MRPFFAAALLLTTACGPKVPEIPPDQPVVAAPMLLGDCVRSVLLAHSGTIVKVEGTTDSSRTIYEFDVRSPDGTQWDIECDAVTAKVVEIEQEVNSPSDDPFREKVVITADSAKAIALGAHPGEVIETEYEVESDGAASYEFDIKGPDGSETKVEVDATNGRITEANPETFQIGVE
jgi:uncharacterized membrane protein YkoI